MQDIILAGMILSAALKMMCEVAVILLLHAAVLLIITAAAMAVLTTKFIFGRRQHARER